MQRHRALSLFQPSNFAAAIRVDVGGQATDEPKHLFGSLMTISHTTVAQALAVIGFDFVFVDALHVPTNAEKLVDMIHTIHFASDGKTCCVVRVPSSESDLLPYALDAGASAIVFPQVETAAQAAAAVDKVRYAYSGGNRSVSPVALLNGLTNMVPPGWTPETLADRNIAVICQIESTLGLDNVDAIASTPGINALMLGAGDLRASLGLPARTPLGQKEDAKFLSATAKLVAAAKKHNLPLMAPVFRMDLDALEWVSDFKMLVTSVDILSLVKGHREELAKMKDVTLCNHKENEASVQQPDAVPLEATPETNGAENQHHLQDEAPNGTNGINGDVPDGFELENEINEEHESHTGLIHNGTNGVYIDHHRFLSNHDIVMNMGVRATLATT